MPSRILRNARDTWVDQFKPTKTHEQDKKLGIRASGSGLTKRIFIFFNRPFPRGATILSAKLRMYGVGTGWGSRTVWVAMTDGTGPGYAKTNWNNQPGVKGTLVSKTQTNPADGTEWEWDVTSHMQAVADGESWHGWRLVIDNDARYNFYSSESPDYKPTLEVVWSDNPEAPTTLVPDGGVVGISHPILRFDFTDYGGDETMAALQVQIDPDNNFSSPDFDTGEVAATLPELDLSDTEYEGLDNGETTWWRVRVKDGAGLWSEWSDSASMTRRNKASLEILNPGEDPNNFVTEWTPPIIWDFDGTQTAWRVLVEKVNDLGSNLLVADSGFTAGTDDSWTIPKGALTEDGATYRVIVRVHDQYDREASPNDPPFVSARREFTYAPDGDTTGITGLTATSLPNTPFVELTWSRNTAPDSFTVKRNGVVVDTDIDPSDVLVGDGQYRFVDRTAEPNKTHTWKVAANVNGKHSVDSQVTKAINEVSGIYLWDDDRGLLVLIHGTDPGTWEMTDAAETHYPLNATKPVRITNALRGWSGTITGFLYDGNVPASTYAQRLMRIKERPGRPIMILLNDMAFPAILGDITISPTDSTEPGDKQVSFNFWQVGNYSFDPRL